MTEVAKLSLISCRSVTARKVTKGGVKGVEEEWMGCKGCHLYVLGLHDDGAEVSAVLAGCAPTVLGGRRPARAGISRGRARLVELSNPSRSRSRATRATWG